MPGTCELEHRHAAELDVAGDDAGLGAPPPGSTRGGKALELEWRRGGDDAAASTG